MLKPDIIIATKDYSSRNGAKIRAGIIHTAEGATDEIALGNYFKTTDRDVSSHWGIGQDGGRALYVREQYAAWTALKANPWSVQVELCGFAKWTEKEWMKHPEMLDSTARLMAEWHKDYGFQLKHGTIEELRKGVKAFYDHDDVTKAYGGTHWDVGNGFPWGYVIAKAKAYLTPPKPAPVKAKGETNMEFRVVTKSDGEQVGVLLVRGYNNSLYYRLVNVDGTERPDCAWTHASQVSQVGSGIGAAVDGSGLVIAYNDTAGYVRVVEVKDITVPKAEQEWSEARKLAFKGTSVPTVEKVADGIVVAVRGEKMTACTAHRKNGSWGGWTNLGGRIE